MWLNGPPGRSGRDRRSDRRAIRSEMRLQASVSALFRLAFFLVRLLLRLLWKFGPWLALAATLAALWPVVLVTLTARAWAWATARHPKRVLADAAFFLIMPAAYLGAAALSVRPWTSPARLHQWYLMPWHDYAAATLALIHGAAPAGALGVFAFAVPVGVAVAAPWWAWRCGRMEHGLGGTNAYHRVTWDDMMWRRQSRAARRAVAAPGRVRLTSRRGVPVGVTIRAVGRPWRRVLRIPAADFMRHQILIGGSGSGKTTAMIRLWSGWFAAYQADRHAPRPLLVVVDGKGGPDSRGRAAETIASLRAAGARRCAVWPDSADLSIWHLDPKSLTTLLVQLIESGDGAAAFYADMMAAVVRLAVNAPGGPPGSAGEFLSRLSAEWLAEAYAGTRPALQRQAADVKDHVPSTAMRYSQLLDRLGPELDGTGRLDDPDTDVWYCILEGTAESSVAEVQAMALVELIARAAVAGEPRRRILLGADDYSAVSRRVPLSNLYERGRSLGLGCMMSAQSWEGIGADDDERYRVASTADGGVWLLRSPRPDILAELAGTRDRLNITRKVLAGGSTGDEGSSGVGAVWVAEPQRIRQFSTGQAVYITRGTAVYVHIAPSPMDRTQTGNGMPAPAAPAPAPARPPSPSRPSGWPYQAPGRPPAASGPHDDDVLGPGTGPQNAEPDNQEEEEES